MTDVLAIGTARTNAELMLSCQTLGYLSDDVEVFDATYGKAGGFWKRWKPTLLVTNDMQPGYADHAHDVRALPIEWTDRFGAVVFDPPYKLNGKPAHPSDDRYGVADGATPNERLELIDAGMAECVRVLEPGGHLLVKAQDMVCSGHVVWQMHRVATLGESLGCRLKDQLHLVGYRPQPDGRRQVHARRNYSTLLVFVKQGKRGNR